MSQFIKRGILYAVVFCCMLLARCHAPAKKAGYSYHPKGYYYQLLAFSNDTAAYHAGYMAQLATGFYTQSDSLFWDSRNNLGDNFFINVDTSSAGSFFKQYSSGCSVGDSACLLINTKDFFSQQFNSAQLPFFSRRDSVVKVRFKVKQLLSPQAFAAQHKDLDKKEQQQIADFIASAGKGRVRQDQSGLYCMDCVDGLPADPIYQPGTLLTLAYRGSYLNGRFLEASPEKFELVYGAPDQLLKGLNYVIGRIKIGQNVKIILPSRLAFGENGSTNGIVPPYTPLVYEIKITDVKEQH